MQELFIVIFIILLIVIALYYWPKGKTGGVFGGWTGTSLNLEWQVYRKLLGYVAQAGTDEHLTQWLEKTYDVDKKAKVTPPEPADYPNLYRAVSESFYKISGITSWQDWFTRTGVTNIHALPDGLKPFIVNAPQYYRADAQEEKFIRGLFDINRKRADMFLDTLTLYQLRDKFHPSNNKKLSIDALAKKISKSIRAAEDVFELDRTAVEARVAKLMNYSDEISEPVVDWIISDLRSTKYNWMLSTATMSAKLNSIRLIVAQMQADLIQYKQSPLTVGVPYPVYQEVPVVVNNPVPVYNDYSYLPKGMDRSVYDGLADSGMTHSEIVDAYHDVVKYGLGPDRLDTDHIFKHYAGSCGSCHQSKKEISQKLEDL